MLPVASEELCGMSLKTETLTLEELTLRVVRPAPLFCETSGLTTLNVSSSRVRV